MTPHDLLAPGMLPARAPCFLFLTIGPCLLVLEADRGGTRQAERQTPQDVRLAGPARDRPVWRSTHIWHGLWTPRSKHLCHRHRPGPAPVGLRGLPAFRCRWHRPFPGPHPADGRRRVMAIPARSPGMCVRSGGSGGPIGDCRGGCHPAGREFALLCSSRSAGRSGSSPMVAPSARSRQTAFGEIAANSAAALCGAPLE
jgi:hypothetical protein